MNKKQLLLDLYNAENSQEVYNTVLKYKLDNAKYWKAYGGNPNNAGTFENQQSSPENALVEKLTNSIDAILMKHCYLAGINPKDKTNPAVPQDMDAAIEKFFKVKNGKWENKTSTERNTVAQNIQIILTNDRKTPNVAIYDNGEGQNPSRFPETFLSIAHGNKNDVPFVQGKYNFGATGAVVFCGDTHRYQMIISRRNKELRDGDGKIGFTLVRRHILSSEEEKAVKLTWYEYLVLDDEIPWIDTEALDLGLSGGAMYESGSIVKMFSYQLTKPSDGTLELWRELNPLLFVPALPILIYEKRNFAGHTPSKLMLGNRTRLALDSNNKVRFHKNLQTTLFGSNIPISVYIFDRDTKNPEFIGGKSVIYTLNGQTQGIETKSFISQDLGYRNLREFMLVCVDCSRCGTTARQELFMASRDRLKQGRYYNELKADIISLLRSDDDIRQKDQEYKGRAFRETGEDRDLVESLFSQLKSNKDIKNMFSGSNGAFSFFTKKVKKTIEPSKHEKTDEKTKKNLKRYPSIFKVKGFDKYNQNYVKVIRCGGKGRITLETDVENEFLSRSEDNGSLTITTLDYGNHGGYGGGHHLPTENHTKLKVQAAGPYDGEIQVYIEPKEEVEVGESIPLSIKMISTAGEHEVIVYVKIDKEAEHSRESKEKTVEEPEMSLPKLVRVVKESSSDDELTWSDCGMTAENIVKLCIGSEGAVDEILINMDSNLVKKLINAKGANIERIRNKYLTNVYAHALMVYTTMYGYYSQKDIMDNYIIKEVQDKLNEAVEFSFRYYANFLMSFEELSD